MKYLIPFTLLLSLLFFYNNCSDNKGNDVLPLKKVDIRCLHSAANDCNSLNENSLIFIGLIQTSKSKCADLLTSSNISNLYQLFEASAVLQVNHDIELNSLSASFSNWVNAEGLSINSLNNTTHSICGFIDTNADGLLTNTEPLLELRIPLQEIHILTLEAWDNY